MRAKLMWALALGALLLVVSISPALASTGRSGARAAASKPTTSKPTVSSALASLQRSGQITSALYTQYTGTYTSAKRSLSRLSGTRRAELGVVLANVEAMAAGGDFIASRLPVMFLTLERNRQWWTTEPLLGSGERVSFPGSRIVWEHYAGQGIEIQWLGDVRHGQRLLPVRPRKREPAASCSAK